MSRFSRIPTPRLTVDQGRSPRSLLRAPGAVLHATKQAAAGSKGLSGFVHVVDDDASFRKAMERD